MEEREVSIEDKPRVVIRLRKAEEGVKAEVMMPGAVLRELAGASPGQGVRYAAGGLVDLELELVWVDLDLEPPHSELVEVHLYVPFDDA